MQILSDVFIRNKRKKLMDIGRVAGYVCYQVHDVKKHPARVLFKPRNTFVILFHI